MPPQGPRPSIRLIQKRGSPEDVLLRANEYLGEGYFEKAIKLYTEVLYKLSSASICALLNRSLAYTRFQLPELAVVDAYRAAIVANQMREDADNGHAKYQAAVKYLRSERSHVNRNEAWTSSRRRFIREEWAYSALSSIVINDTPEIKSLGDPRHEPFSTTKRSVVCVALEIRAIYRLCGALYRCGGGARADALGMIDDTLHHCRGIEAWEWAYFQRLGNIIVLDTMQPWDDGLYDPQGFVSMSKSMRRKQEEERQKTKESMKAKGTSLSLSCYYWDVYEPELDNLDWQRLLLSWVHKSSSNCTPRVIGSDDIGYNDKLDEKPVPYAELRAGRDIIAGELVLSEQTMSNVTTSIPEDVFEDRPQRCARRFYCDTCSSLLLVPPECSIKYKDTVVPHPTSPSHASATPEKPKPAEDSETIAHGSGSESTDLDPMIFSGDKSPPTALKETADQLPPHQPPFVQAPPAIPDFTFCCPTHDVPTCSAACRKGHELFDRGLCHTSIERDLRNNYLLGSPTLIPLTDHKSQCLVDLLFLRIFAKSFNKRTHPLQDVDLVFATCGPNRQDAVDKERTWSFMANVVRPLLYLERFFEQTDTDQFAYLDTCDGWIINTLMSKISTAMRVSKSPRYAKTFDRHANLLSIVTPSDEAWSDIVFKEGARSPDEQDLQPWIASIQPIFNLIRVADPDKGEIPNVAVVQDEGIRCYAISRDGLEPAIKLGQVLVRAGDIDDKERQRIERMLLERNGVGVAPGGGVIAGTLDQNNKDEDSEESTDKADAAVTAEATEMDIDT